MSYEFNRVWLARKFEEIQKRILKALHQLDDEQVNWSPGANSHSISTIIRHIEGNILERVNKGVLRQNIIRDREAELKPTFVAKEELSRIIQERLQFVIDTTRSLSDEQLEQTQPVRGKERCNLDMLHQCAAHYSEHMGQIFYIAKQLLKEEYQSTSI
ncbi:DinB family protein [Paenibacillus sp. MMO-177]|uniref:DinB family protein n=1 Tax=Paenibacillus sp. MMO-177 TaxID=3081289 RepID=UPI003018B523